MYNDANSLIVIDHHESAKNNLEGLDFCKFDMSKSGAVLLWEYLFPNVEVPILLKYIQDRDLWNWELKDSREVSAGLQLIPYTDYSEYNKYLNNVEPLKLKGSAILEYQNKIIGGIERSIDYLPLVRLTNCDTRLPLLNTTTLISEIGNMLSITFGGAVMYFDKGDKRIFSLRSNGEIDVSKIAEAYNGGGHKAAAGFSIDFKDLDFEAMHGPKRIIRKK